MFTGVKRLRVLLDPHVRVDDEGKGER